MLIIYDLLSLSLLLLLPRYDFFCWLFVVSYSYDLRSIKSKETWAAVVAAVRSFVGCQIEWLALLPPSLPAAVAVSLDFRIWRLLLHYVNCNEIIIRSWNRDYQHQQQCQRQLHHRQQLYMQIWNSCKWASYKCKFFLVRSLGLSRALARISYKICPSIGGFCLCNLFAH